MANNSICFSFQDRNTRFAHLITIIRNLEKINLVREQRQLSTLSVRSSFALRLLVALALQPFVSFPQMFSRTNQLRHQSKLRFPRQLGPSAAALSWLSSVRCSSSIYRSSRPRSNTSRRAFTSFAVGGWTFDRTLCKVFSFYVQDGEWLLFLNVYIYIYIYISEFLLHTIYA